jgi:hypothetical protein
VSGSGVLTRVGLAIGDDWQTFLSSRLEKLDVEVYNGDVLVQFARDGYTYEPDDPTTHGIRLRRGSFTSLAALSQTYNPGPIAFRFKRAAAGVAATVDFVAYPA